MCKFLYFLLFSFFSLSIGFVQASTEKPASLALQAGTPPVFLDPEELVSDLIKKASDFENLSAQDDLLILLENYFDFLAMARFVLGRTVKQINEAQLREFITLFTENQVLSLLPHIKDIDSIELLRKSTNKNKTLLIFNYIRKGSHQAIEIGIYVRKVNGVLKIYDMQIEGVRLLLTWRSEFRSLIRNKGFEGMMNYLRDRLEGIRVI